MCSCLTCTVTGSSSSVHPSSSDPWPQRAGWGSCPGPARRSTSGTIAHTRPSFVPARLAHPLIPASWARLANCVEAMAMEAWPMTESWFRTQLDLLIRAQCCRSSGSAAWKEERIETCWGWPRSARTAHPVSLAHFRCMGIARLDRIAPRGIRNRALAAPRTGLKSLPQDQRLPCPSASPRFPIATAMDPGHLPAPAQSLDPACGAEPQTLVITAPDATGRVPRSWRSDQPCSDCPWRHGAEIATCLESIAQASGHRPPCDALEQLPSISCSGLTEQRIRQVAARALARPMARSVGGRSR